MDHFFQIEVVGAAEEPMLEGYSALNFVAGVTERAKLGTLVTGVQYRHPGVLLKTVTTLDVLSEGRAYLGIRRRLVRARVPRARRPVPPDRGALRTAGGDTPDRPPDVVGRHRALQG
jgi:alkanesulfonate monooxygenase SsuD/methylene tetrahydromethanopterin reductase-like flavin-dependent oxidoreductase (luciferase family)